MSQTSGSFREYLNFGQILSSEIRFIELGSRSGGIKHKPLQYSKTIWVPSIFLLHGFSSQTCVTASLVYTCKRICQTSARKPRNQRKHQQLCVNFLSRGQFWCVDGFRQALTWCAAERTANTGFPNRMLYAFINLQPSILLWDVNSRAKISFGRLSVVTRGSTEDKSTIDVSYYYECMGLG